MKIVPTMVEFFRTTAIIMAYEYLDIPIEPDSISGCFDIERLQELKLFCLHNPDYHIVSVVNGNMYFNKPQPNASIFLLAEGDSNPELVCFEK